MNLFAEPIHVPTGTVTMRPYQEKALQAIEGDMDRGPGQGLLVLPTGTGKTSVFTELIARRRRLNPDFRALILAHQIELLDQAAGRIRHMIPGAIVGTESGDHRASTRSEVVVAGVQSIGRRGNTKLEWLKPDLIITDEAHHACFVAGTLVGGNAIESLEIGDEVECYDHQGDRIVRRRICALHRSPVPNALWRFTVGGETFVCTGDHPIWDGNQYVPARCFKVGASFFGRITPRSLVTDGNSLLTSNQAESLRCLRENLSASELELNHDANMLSRVQGDTTGISREESRKQLHPVRRDGAGIRTFGFGDGEAREGVLLPGMPGFIRIKTKLGANGKHQSGPRVEANEGEQPHEVGRCAREDGEDAQGHWVQAQSSGRERQADRASEETRSGIGLADGSGGERSTSESRDSRASDRAEDRHCESREDDRDRGGRVVTRGLESSKSRRAERSSLDAFRVDRIEILEPGSDGTFGGVCPDGVVYNISVAEFPNYFVNGLLVHNCADSYQAVYDNFGVYADDGPYHLGVTATPHRMDNKPLHGSDRAIFSKILYQYTLKEAIADGFLSNVRGYRVAAQGLDLSGIKKTAGDYNQRELQTVMDTDEVTASGITSWGRVAKNRRTLVFCTGVEHAANVAKAFRALGFRAESIDGSMRPEVRDAVMRRFRSGETQVLTNMQLVTEGVDVPEIGCVLLLRPTQSWALYTQMVGRGLRLSEGKADCIVIDVVGNSEAHQLGKNPPASLAGVFGLPPGLDLSGKLATEAVEIFDELTDSQQSGLFKRILDMDGLSAALTEVDLLAELGIPNEIEGFTAWSWMKLGDGHYMLGCGSNDSEGRMRADMFEDALGEWTLILKSDQRNEKHDLGDNLRGAFRTAERLAAIRWPEVGRVVDTRAAWRKAPPSDKQVSFLRKIGIKPEDIARMNKGQASTLMSQHFAKAKGGRR